MTTVCLPSGRLRLHRDPLDGAHLFSLPAWLKPSRNGGVYWHMPRAAAKYPPTRWNPEPRIVVHLWCGQSRHVRSRSEFRRTAPESFACGTCVGRHAGYVGADGLVFTPVDHWRLPNWCPGEGGRTGICRACGERVRWYRDHEANHHPRSALAERFSPCPRHGWSHVRTRDGELVCTSWRCGE